MFICIATQHIYLVRGIMPTLHAWLQWVSSIYCLPTASAQGPQEKWESMGEAVAHMAEISIPNCLDLSSQKRLVWF